jgi:hypothetical protein
MKIFLLIICFIESAIAASMNVDIGQTSTVYNRFSIPKSETDKISLPTGDQLTSFRLTGYFDLASKNQIYFLIAPLETYSEFESTKSFTFNETSFADNTNTEVTYKFNSYRLGYLWTWENSSFKYWLGAVAKIRDANITVTQGSESDSYKNIGLVPLASVGFNLILWQGVSLFSHTDALGSGQGSAYDSQIEIKVSSADYGVSLGKRILGGGADNEKVYTFAQFDTYYLRLTSYF